MLLLLACAEPFDVRRQDLGPLRIAAVGVVDGRASAAVWSGEGMGHATAPQLTWTLDGDELGTGWDVAVAAPGTLELVVEAGQEVEHAQVSVAYADAFEWTRDGDDVVRLELDAGDRTARWMTAHGVNEVVPLEPLVGQVTWDEAGHAQHLALVQDGVGGNRWAWIDTAYDVPGLVRHEGRLLEAETDTVGVVTATLVEAADGGVGLADVSTDLEGVVQPDCAPASPFRTAWVADGRCGLDEVLGLRVEIELW